MKDAILNGTTGTKQSVKLQRFDYLPVALFGSVMGLSGLSIAWKLAAAQYGVPREIALVISVVAIIAFLCLALAYTLKALTAFDAVRAEFNHPIAGSLFGTISISLLLLPILLVGLNLALARGLWLVGAFAMTFIAWRTVLRWLSHQQQTVHATPAWIVPVVGMLDIPLAFPLLDLPALHDVMIFALAVGLFFSVPLVTMIFSRLMFETRIPDAMQPTLLIMIAPFAVGFSAYVVTTGHIDLFAQGLLFINLFMLTVLLGRLRHLLRCCPFRLAWWAVSFPLAATAVAAIKFDAFEHSLLSTGLAFIVLAGASIVIAALLLRTLIGIAKGELRTLSS
jgi:tellurite resistance protein